MQTQKGYLTQVYSSIRHKSKRRGHPMPKFTKQELAVWLYKNNLHVMWINYLESNCDKYLKPSIDRKDDYKGYSFNNMQLITWRENLTKGVNGGKHHKNAHNQNLRKKCFIWNVYGILVKEFDKYEDAAIYLDSHVVSVSRAITGKRKTLKGYILTNVKKFVTHY